MTDLMIKANNKELKVKHLYTVDNYITFNVKVTSGEFSGASNFCFSQEGINFFVEKLSQMYGTLQGACEIRGNDSDAYIIVKMEKLGHLYLAGQIGGSHEDHYMRFKFEIDQTILPIFISVLRKH